MHPVKVSLKTHNAELTHVAVLSALLKQANKRDQNILVAEVFTVNPTVTARILQIDGFKPRSRFL